MTNVVDEKKPRIPKVGDVKMVKVHPLAGKCGEGPPLAPESWKWRAGNRLSDMYFTSPTGEKFRSRPELNIFLATLDNPPPLDSFRWRVTEDFLAKHQVIAQDARRRQSGEGGSKKQNEESCAEKKATKRKDVVDDAQEKRKKKVKTEISTTPQQPSPPPTVPNTDASPIPHTPIPESAPASQGGVADTDGIFKTPSAKRRSKVKANKKDHFDKDCGDRFFPSILASKASWKWLYDNEVATRFLAEAEKLKGKDELEIPDFRNLLLHRSSDMNNISRYSNQVLRVFVQIMRNVEPPASMGKVELVHLVVSWKCKKKHQWCLLETTRLATPDSKSSKGDGCPAGSRDDKLPGQNATVSSNRGSIPASEGTTNRGQIAGASAQRESISRSGGSKKTPRGREQFVEPLGNLHNPGFRSQSSPLDLNVKLPSGPEVVTAKEEPGHETDSQQIPMPKANAHIPKSAKPRAGAGLSRSGGKKSSAPGASTPANRGSGATEGSAHPPEVVAASEARYNVQYKQNENVVILQRISTNAEGNQSTANQLHGVRLPPGEVQGSSTRADGSNVMESTQEVPPVPPTCNTDKDGSDCRCKVCSSDHGFCRGCMCCFCSNAVKPEDDWMALRCDCKHLSHVKCAMEKKMAGVVKELELDAELSCPSCSQKLDLGPFFVKSFDRLHGEDPKMHPTDLGPLVVLVLQLLEGSENKKYKYFQKLVEEMYNLMTKFPIQDLVRLLLTEIKKELHEPVDPDLGGSHVGEAAIEAAVKRRVDMEPLFNTLQSAYQSLVDQTKLARLTKASDRAKQRVMEREMEGLEAEDDQISPASILVQIENQKKIAQQEFEKLGRLKNTMVKADSPSFIDIDASMNKWLESLRAQRKEVESAEAELRRLEHQYRRSIGF
ncbi:hypothetical protein MPTK1_2g18710 [Marchantia polymorpha subsp. ruderalis]|uniref:MBD domain-containing protein n=1 Tax=Marchantia polymorpha TaxID=3197 RepID=A0A2R6W724_MARPO|nr:hypothetical protein MARPO_0137s0011 [Marchantia polymorpha]BBN02853.1 hypothetical protein Mp_2g18710 [Marchantia polymorpha subsp. ruderalis]|eukprot:PTQ29643.1 hypothetical protein MARPO_0137s0011 [Marchantia polymorpha]